MIDRRSEESKYVKMVSRKVTGCVVVDKELFVSSISPMARRMGARPGGAGETSWHHASDYMGRTSLKAQDQTNGNTRPYQATFGCTTATMLSGVLLFNQKGESNSSPC